MRKKIATVFLAIFCVTYVAQCGEEDALSKDVKLTLVPEDPIVVNADITLRPGTESEQTIPGPWFLFRYSIFNGSDRELSLVTYIFKISGIRNGARFIEEASIDPSSACTDPDNNLRAFLAIVPAGATASGAVETSPMVGNCNPRILEVPPDYEGWYIALPEADNTFYSIDVEAAGWFENADRIPIERLDVFGSLFTQ